MPKRIQYEKGDKFGMLSVIRELEPHECERGEDSKRKSTKRTFLFQCECWNTKEIVIASVKSWLTTSCWCYNKSKWMTHWMHGTRFYKIWNYLTQRATNPNNSSAKEYVLRWIWVCDKWLKFEWFMEDMHQAYEKHFKENWGDTSIDRIDNDGDYCKENCRWATIKQQNRNKSCTKIYEYKWEELVLWEIAEKLWMQRTTLNRRIGMWMSLEQAISWKPWKHYKKRDSD